MQAANLGPMAVTLVAVVDFSGSMAGAKLRRVKDTLNYMIDNLSDQVGTSVGRCRRRCARWLHPCAVYVGCMLCVARGCDAASQPSPSCRTEPAPCGLAVRRVPVCMDSSRRRVDARAALTCGGSAWRAVCREWSATRAWGCTGHLRTRGIPLHGLDCLCCRHVVTCACLAVLPCH